MDSTIADVSNLSAPGGGAGSITAAQFLQRFTRDVAWAHMISLVPRGFLHTMAFMLKDRRVQGGNSS